MYAPGGVAARTSGRFGRDDICGAIPDQQRILWKDAEPVQGKLDTFGVRLVAGHVLESNHHREQARHSEFVELAGRSGTAALDLELAFLLS